MSLRPDRVRWWTPLSALAAPAALIGSWTIAAARRPDFHPVTDTISALAASGAPDRWIVTAGLAVTGCCHLLTAAGLTSAARPGRVLLAVGGVSTLAVAAFPLPAEHGSSSAHAISATAAFVALSVWPAVAVRADAVGAGNPFRRPVGYAAGGVLMVTLGAFGIALTQGRCVGLAERVAAGAQSLWPLAAVASNRLATTRVLRQRPRLG